MRHRTSAICLRATDYSETSQVVSFFTRDCGLVRLLAKGTKRPKSKSGGAIDLLSEGDLVFTTSRSGGLGTLIEFTESVSRAALRREAGRLNVALYAIELIGEMLAEDDPLAEAFDLLHNVLVRLAEPDAPLAAVLAYYQWRLLKHVGLLGEMNRCVSCGCRVGEGTPTGSKPGPPVYFCSKLGGLLCGNCEAGEQEKYRVDDAALAGAATLSAAEAGRKVSLPDRQAHSVNRLLAYHITHQLGKRLRMAKHAIGVTSAEVGRSST